MTKMIRTFICIELPTSLKTRLEKLTVELQKQSTTKVSWVKPTNMHLTLRFLGDITEDKILDIKACVEQACLAVKSFNLTVSELGAFPSLRRPRVFWVGIKDPSVQLIPIQKKLEQELITAGFGASDHPFSPHLTLGRVKEGDGQDITAKLTQTEFALEIFSVKEIIVMRSELKPTGAVYSKIAPVKLSN
jgi:2'-5' RNA ligase